MACDEDAQADTVAKLLHKTIFMDKPCSNIGNIWDEKRLKRGVKSLLQKNISSSKVVIPLYREPDNTAIFLSSSSMLSLHSTAFLFDKGILSIKSILRAPFTVNILSVVNFVLTGNFVLNFSVSTTVD
jgi:hypothetical protein